MFPADRSRTHLAAILAAVLLVGVLPAAVLATGPTAGDDHVSVPVDAPATTIDVVSNDSVGVTIAAVETTTPAAHGTVVIAGDALSLTYEPVASFHGMDTFDYTISDGADSASATVTVDVNSPPLAVDDPGEACGDTSDWGGAFPVPEDWVGTSVPTDYFILFGSCGLLANDTDPDGDTMTYEIHTGAIHGNVIKFDESLFGYRPDPNFSTGPGDQPGGQWISDSFTYRACDPYACSAPATMKYWVAPVNDVPTFTPDGTVTVAEDSGQHSATWATNVSPGPLESDQTVHFELDGPSPIEEHASGELFSVPPAIGGDGTLTFTLNPDAYGYALVAMVAKDDGGLPAYLGVTAPTPQSDDTTDPFTFRIDVTADAVTAVDDAVQLPEDPDPSPWLVDVLDNDRHPLGSAVTAVTQGTLGDVTIAPDGQSVLYAPHLNANGADTFTYVLDDGAGSTDTATVSLAIDPRNDAPAGADATIVVLEGSSHALAPADFGFSDPSDSPANALLAVRITTLPGAGGLTDDGAAVSAGDSIPVADIIANKLVFTPAPDGQGSPYTTFTFQVQDDGGLIGEDLDPTPNTITFDVTGLNHAPAGTNWTIDTNEDTPWALVAADFGFSDPGDTPADVLSGVAISTLPESGSLKDDGGAVVAGTIVPVADIAANKLVFTPASDGNGSPYTTFTFQVRDDGGTFGGGVDLDQSPNTITINVTAVNDDPVAATDSLTVSEDAVATAVPVLTNDTDVEGDPRTITATTDGARGVVVLTSSTTLTYKPNANANGSDSFTYTISDGHGGAAIGTVNVTITPSNDRPNAVNDVAFSIPESAGATALSVLANDTDVDADTLTITATTNGAHGTVTITGAGTGLTYDPVQLYYGTDVFTYTIGDGHGGADTATVLLTIVKDNTKPVVSGPVESFYRQTVGSSTMNVRIGWSGSDTGGTGIAKYKLQVSTNGGTYSTIALASATSTSIKRTLTDGRSYRYRVRATDRQGNVSSWVYGPTFTPGRLQNTSSRVTYSGAWTTKSSAGALGGSHRYSSSPSAAASITRTVRDVAVVATRTSGSGSAQVWVDGVLATTINLRSTSTTYRQLVFSRHFPTLGSHKLEIRPIGGGRVYLDAFLVYR